MQEHPQETEERVGVALDELVERPPIALRRPGEESPV